MEQVFADAFYDFQENSGDQTAVDAYIDLVDLYLRVLRETTSWLCADGRRGAPVGRLIAAAADESNDLTIITFNHDLVIENEIHRRARLRRRWCLDQGYGSFSDELDIRKQRDNSPVFDEHQANECDHSRPIRIRAKYSCSTDDSS
jgi:hypothetical protein